VSVLATVTRQLSTSPTFPGVSGSTQSSGGVSNVPISIPQTAFPAASSNVSLTLAFPFATLQQIILLSDKGMTLKFNSTSSPVPEIVLQPGSPFEWNSSDGYFANPFTANITQVFVSCTPASRLTGFILCS
jgi:hypothetical protein